MATKKFDPEDFEAFLKLLPREVGKLPLRHALEVRHPSFKDQRFYDLARKHNVAIVFADDEDFPAIDEPTADFTYARLMGAKEEVEDRLQAAPSSTTGPRRAKAWAKTRRRLRLFHLRRQGARSGGGAGADRQV